MHTTTFTCSVAKNIAKIMQRNTMRFIRVCHEPRSCGMLSSTIYDQWAQLGCQSRSSTDSFVFSEVWKIMTGFPKNIAICCMLQNARPSPSGAQCLSLRLFKSCSNWRIIKKRQPYGQASHLIFHEKRTFTTTSHKTMRWSSARVASISSFQGQKNHKQSSVKPGYLEYSWLRVNLGFNMFQPLWWDKIPNQWVEKFLGSLISRSAQAQGLGNPQKWDLLWLPVGPPDVHGC